MLWIRPTEIQAVSGVCLSVEDLPCSGNRGGIAIALVLLFSEPIGSAVKANSGEGNGAVFVAMFPKNLFPPIPSELILPLGGFCVQQGMLAELAVVLAGLLAIVIFALPCYGTCRLVNEQRIEGGLVCHGRWIGIRSQAPGRGRA